MAPASRKSRGLASCCAQNPGTQEESAKKRRFYFHERWSWFTRPIAPSLPPCPSIETTICCQLARRGEDEPASLPECSSRSKGGYSTLAVLPPLPHQVAGSVPHTGDRLSITMPSPWRRKRRRVHCEAGPRLSSGRIFSLEMSHRCSVTRDLSQIVATSTTRLSQPGRSQVPVARWTPAAHHQLAAQPDTGVSFPPQLLDACLARTPDGKNWPCQLRSLGS